MYTSCLRLAALISLIGLCLSSADLQAAELDTGQFVPACTKDPVVTEDPGFDEAKVTPQTFCECVAGKLKENSASQADVDMLVKLHNEDITDADAANFETLDDLLVANEGFEDECRQVLGIASEDDDMEDFPMEEEIPEEGEPPADGPPADEPQD